MQQKYWRACLTFIFTRWMYTIMVNSQNEKVISRHCKVYSKAYSATTNIYLYELSDIVEYIQFLTHDDGGGIA